jgi:proteasome accessory factor A
MERQELVDRRFGSEIEYTHTPNTILRERRMPTTGKHLGEFLSNGGRLYLDAELIEYATPECSTLEELVTHELAGEQQAWEAYGNGRSRIETLHKRASSPNREHTLGAHENYSTIGLIWRKENNNHLSNRESLAAHFATRTIFIGTGQPTDAGYILGQKIDGIHNDWASGNNNRRSKSLVDLREEHVSGGSELKRLHVTSGDANMSPWAIRMKFGTTSLVLRLLEHGVDISDLHLADPLDSAKEVASGVAGINKPLLLKSGERASALDIQEELAKRAWKLSEDIELPQEEQQVLGDWVSTIDSLREYTKNEQRIPDLRQIDWYAKKELLDMDREKHGGITRERENNIDVGYHRIPNGIGVRLRKKWFAANMVTDKSIETAKTEPVRGRATMRRAIIEKVHEMGLQDKLDRNINWDGFNATIPPKRDAQIIYGKNDLLPLDVDYTDVEIQRRLDQWFGDSTQ